ncbi:MAG TPA: hypothetical protein VGH89_12925 [Pseudonocardia sp.]
MHNTVRHALAVAAGVGAVLAATAGVAYADSDSGGNSHHPNGTGSGLSGGPTQTQVLPDGSAPVPLSDPTLGEGTALPPAYNTLGGATG